MTNRIVRKRVVLASVIVGAFLTSVQESRSALNIANRRGKIHVYLVSTGGVPLEGMAAKLFAADGKLQAESRESVFTDVPYGSYHLTVTKEGFYTASIPVAVDKARVWVTVGLALGMDRSDMYVAFTGTVVNKAMIPPVWVKLVSLYTDYTATVAVDQFGKFRFRVPYEKSGRALLLTFLGPKLYDRREVFVRDGEPDLTIR